MRAVVPEVNVAALDIGVNGETLTIRGEWKQPEVPKSVRYYVLERPTGRFERRLQFPVPLNADAVQATCENGILTFALLKSEAAKPRDRRTWSAAADRSQDGIVISRVVRHAATRVSKDRTI